MQHFECDYMEGAHPLILKKLSEINMEKNPGYGVDIYCERAKEKIREACGKKDAQVYFLVGGTQTNATVIDTFLNSYEGVVAARTGHINVHESGAIEQAGHKVIGIEETNGKISSDVLKKYLTDFYADDDYEHMVLPGMVYISHPTEYGTLYTKDELEKISAVCHEYKIPLYLDGARLGYGLAAEGTDVTLEVVTECCDAFYIGGTKVGALFGEAVVVTNKERFKHFKTIVKQHGALLAKGWLIGIQFDTLFTDNLYLDIARHANIMADKIKKCLINKGYKLYIDSNTNQQFVIMDNQRMKEIMTKVTFSNWEKYDENNTIVRFATSWATKKEDVDALLGLL